MYLLSPFSDYIMHLYSYSIHNSLLAYSCLSCPSNQHLFQEPRTQSREKGLYEAEARAEWDYACAHNSNYGSARHNELDQSKSITGSKESD